MDTEYDRKFEEMKKYIPFLENMITRLESTNTASSSNPRQAQLDKIRSLRDLLSNKKKRMKMENLLKCEQVLINLYAKVEQRDNLSGAKKTDSGFSIDTPTSKEKSDLEAVRNKLKTVVKRQENIQDTLPEILPRSEVNDVHTSGTKEPALFQRRPNQQQKITNTDSEENKISPPGSAAKRNYTRVLVSPESSSRRWSAAETTGEKPLFSRRSPRKSPRRYSPAYYKKERKKSKDSRKQRDLNITLNVPEESLNSLNTKDILSRIINCSDGDVDIDTLRELRKQILGELQKTGAKDDISDLILKSYNKKKSKPKNTEEVEEGELSDSESEAIESIYGSLVVKEPGQVKTSSDKDNQPRKIQICLVINSDDKPESNAKELTKKDLSADFAEFEMYDKKEATKSNADEKKKKEVVDLTKKACLENDEKPVATCQKNTSEVKGIESQKAPPTDKVTITPTLKDTVPSPVKMNENMTTPTNVITSLTENDATQTFESTPTESSQFKANFYKPLTEQNNLNTAEPIMNKDETTDNVVSDSHTRTDTSAVNITDIESKLQKMETSPEIPLLHDRTIEKKPPDSTLSEIDILQALKNEILSEITVPGAETTTPLLHQPKIIKVASAQGILPKKRISIEKYKEKTVTSSVSQSSKVSQKEDQTKKTSLKLTVKECERFNIPKISFDEEDESLDEDDGDILASDVYGDLAPKSPDHDDSGNIELTPPVIIPVDPVKNSQVIHKADVDMRTLPLLSPNSTKTTAIYNNIVGQPTNDLPADKTKAEISQNRSQLVDPRVKRDLNPNISNGSPNPHAGNPERTPRHMFSGILPGSTSNPIMTPNARTYEMTPTHQLFEVDQSNRGHVYVPTITTWEREKSVPRETHWDSKDSAGERRSRVDDYRDSNWNPQKDDASQNKYNIGHKNNRYDPREDMYKRSDCSKTSSFSRSDVPVTPTQSYGRIDMPMTPLPSFGRSECPPTPSHSFGRLECPSTPSHPFGRTECPSTPSHPFGRSDCPPTPSHSFGRSDCPPTPSHSFGRIDCPPTPSHPFGRSDCPPTPSHSFGRIDCPPTPSHSFGRSDCPSTPSHPFGRNEGPPPLMLGMVDGPPTPGNSFGGVDCPPIPSPLFGRSECSPTGSHTSQTSFGRSDSSKNQYNRSEYGNQKYTKDPRLYRKSDSDGKPKYDERDRGYYKDQDRYRSSSYSSQKSFSGSDNYRNYDREQNSGRNNRYKYVAPELRGSLYKRDQERHERSVGRSTSKDHERDERRYSNDVRSYEEVGSRREYQSEKNIGRCNFRLQGEGTRSSVRASSVGKSISKDPDHKKLSVQSNVGRSFTIDTSVNTTFQKYTDNAKEIQGYVNSFDARRQRAASVGRYLTRESSVGRTQPLQVSKAKNDTVNKREAFRRASSVGRDVFDNNKEKRSFQEIKADFKSYKFSPREFNKDKDSESDSNSKSKMVTEHFGRSRKDMYERQRDEKRGNELSKSAYKPKMNYRDPRMRKLLKNKSDKYDSDESVRKSGIVYSNDNIVTGSIMAPGYGVKNYKIPKIKRVTEEKEATPEKTDTGKKDEKEKFKTKKSNGNSKESIKEKLNVKGQKGKGKTTDVSGEKEIILSAAATEENEKPHKNVGKSEEHIEKRPTRFNKVETEEGQIGKTKKYKKVIYDTDSDDEIETNDKDGTIEKTNTKSKNADIKGKDSDTHDNIVDMEINTSPTDNSKTELTEASSIAKDKENTKLDSTDLSSSFGIDELEMFADNIVSDPVIDNITDLIADLDNDLSTSKSETFTKEITLENMMQNISSPENFSDMQFGEDSTEILAVTDKISKDEKDSVYNKQINENVVLSNSMATDNVGTPVVGLNNVKEPAGNMPTQSDAVHSKRNESSEDIPYTSSAKSNNEDIVSTTEIEKDRKPVDKPMLDELSKDSCSTPDSTINTDDALQKSNNEDSLPGNTNEVTSTESIETKPSASAKEISSGLDSISLLSILQDKSKIKELLSMLGDQSSQNEKIKKKLEKLSEIVSDDEETCDVPTAANTEQKEIAESKPSVVTDNKNIVSKETINEQDVKVSEEQLDKDGSNLLCENDFKIDDDSKSFDMEAETQEMDTSIQNVETVPQKKKPVKKTKGMKKAKGKPKKVTSIAVKRVTRATAAETKPKVKKPPRELMQLQEDIKEMFIRDEVLGATGLRMCRLAKLVDEKVSPPKEDPVVSEVGPVVLLQKFSDTTTDKSLDLEKVKKKKLAPKIKAKNLNDSGSETVKRDKTPVTFKHKPGPKSKTKNKKEADPYAFESDSVGDTNTEKASEDGSSSSSDSESDSLASSQSYGSGELLADIKKKTKRKRRGWQAGVIKTKSKKRKTEPKQPDRSLEDTFEDLLPEKRSIADINCFTDRTYCFRKNLFSYPCRLCTFTGTDIVLHYRNQHPHVQIPLSRMTPEVAKEAIEQCEEINFKTVSKIPSEKYVCTFCYKEFVNSKSVLETFFWHIVSMHTGEYKQICSECPNVIECPYNLDIPPPPKDAKGQLIGFICQKCNFTQISLENLKTHVIVHHNDEQTAVYKINLSVMTKKTLNSLLRRSEAGQIGTSTHTLDQFVAEIRNSIEKDSESEGVKTRNAKRKSILPVSPPIQSKITFEGDDNVSEMSDMMSESGDTTIKLERIDSENVDTISTNEEGLATDVSEMDRSFDAEDQLPNQTPEYSEPEPSNDIVNYPHFKISHTESGAKEYFCCINGNYHFKTTLLISMKKHVQTKHSENWDGYCYVCKVIVTPQGAHRFRDCLQHYLDKHMDHFPIFEKEMIETAPPQLPVTTKEAPVEQPSVSKPKIHVRRLSELTKTDEGASEENTTFPIIQSVVSLGAAPVELPQAIPTYPAVDKEKETVEKIFQYEEHQAEVISKKYYLVLQSMLTPDSLVKIFKCSGKFCLYATDLPEEALAHATTHQRVGGIDALNCSYCDFDAAGNAIDLVMHVFKNHGSCRYCCQQCFYRAASSQAVGAHMSRVHGTAPVPGSVLRSTKELAIPSTKAVMLTREQAVSYYICAHSDREDACKFRAYTPDKFCEHLIQRHSTAQAHPCNLCSVQVSTATDLVQHMKSHGLKLYQCTWCVYGGDNESEMLMHVSAVHPDKQPQAYIRIITNKDGTALRVLPLAFLTKHKVPTKDVTPPVTNEHPVREAERSVQMEALIGPFMSEPEPTETPIIQNVNTEIPLETSELPEDVIQTEKETKPTQNELIPNPSAPEPVVPAPSTSQIVTPTDIQSTSEVVTPTVIPKTSQVITPTVIPDAEATPVKKEPIETAKNAEPNDIVVLESDDEDAPTSNQAPMVIDLSDDEASTNDGISTPKKDNKEVKIIPDGILHTCPRCKITCKNMGGFKKHVHSCVGNTTEALQCPHCTYLANTLELLAYHYVADHSKKNTYVCGICTALLTTENFARKHMKHVHKIPFSNMAIRSDGTTRFTITEKIKLQSDTPKERVVPKRKLSGSKTEPQLPKRRYEPQEIDQLPINPILDHLVYCSQCEFSTKVRLNMVRHLQLHAEQQPVPQTAPVNPVPHLESNEKHFDKMVNLASSSSAVNRKTEKSRTEHTPSVTLVIPPEAATRYPKYVPERQRHTCGAKGCSYTSVDDAMLRRHWDALHSGTSEFHCVHCPPHQHLDTSKPLTANRVAAHLKMHDATLYACSSCSYYHFKKEIVEKHLSDVHTGGRLMVVREEYNPPVSPSPVQNNAPTMDLKPWQCGLCKFKSMLRPEVADHCFKFHQSKMQFKCAYCPFRTSAIENISKHQANSHAGKPEEVFYYYYREGSIPDEADGSPRWLKQRQKAGPSEPEVKVETSVSPVPKAVSTPLAVDLNLVKKEVNDAPAIAANVVHNLEELCKLFGPFCEPNGIKFKCPLCSVVMEDTKEGMQSHLYEELNYRKWSCGLCSYKAFHKVGLTDHMSSEHRKQYDHIELPTDVNIEKWVTGVLDHQTAIIDKHKENLARQKIVVDTNKPGPSNEVVVTKETGGKYSDKDLETAFGSFGAPNCIMYCCPKCGYLCKDEVSMRDHLEMELNKIRWCCNNCPDQFQTYHEAQFHCKGHDIPSRPVEARRDPAMRTAWITTAIEKQKQIIQNIPMATSEHPTADTSLPDTDNSLLVVRYEESVPTPEQVSMRRKRSAPDSDDDKLTIDEPTPKKKPEKHCLYCDFKSIYPNSVKMHMLTHFGLKPFTCGYCPFDSYTKKAIYKHIEQMHGNKPLKLKMAELPADAKTKKPSEADTPTLICLVCEKPVPEAETNTHLHNNIKPPFSKSNIVRKCCICLDLCLDSKSLEEHQTIAHPGEPINYALYKLGFDSRETFNCAYCSNKFKYIRDYRAHHSAVHTTLPFNLSSSPYVASGTSMENMGPVVHRRCARKSTTKLPNSVAKKSTTKLPYTVPNCLEDSDVEFSYYGSKPLPVQHYANVTTLMSFCNKMMPFSMKQLSEHLNIEPCVKVTDIKKKTQ